MLNLYCAYHTSSFKCVASAVEFEKIKTYEEYLKYTEKWDSYWWEYEYTQEEFELLRRYYNDKDN